MRELGRALLLVGLGLFVVGFGLCGAFGVLGGVFTLIGGHGDFASALLFAIPGGIGLLIAFGAWEGITSLRKRGGPP